MSRKTKISGQVSRGFIGLCAVVGLLFAFAGNPGVAHADEAADAPAGWESAFNNEFFKVNLNVRARMELANMDGFDSSQAYTVRTRLGIGTKPFAGLSFYVEGENIASFAGDQYFDTIESPTGQTVIADPEETELNQLFVRYQNKDALGLDFKAGRQRIKLDDVRFVGNVGWRQNEQTYDAALVSVSPVEHLKATYGYVWDVRRIFGENNRDFDSQSHLINIAYSGIPAAKIVAFAYLLDFDNTRLGGISRLANGMSSNSYGLRLSGKQALSGPWSVNYAASYAVQKDAGDNPVDYTAHYVAAEAGVANADIGGVTVGYELLGSDDGNARFVTPLATLHKFNGWADSFLDNGGTNGLQDLYVAVAPKLPWGLKGKVVYHHFWNDEGNDTLADEVDVVLIKPINKHFTVLTKGAWFDGTSGSGRADRWRYWLELTFNY
ncbi:MAG: alginate export family protein [bacterium]|nr:alginate export family protein [bacterium]